MAVIFQDSFTRANATTLGNATETGQPWVSYGGAVAGVFNNQAYGVSGNHELGFQGRDSGISDGKVTMVFADIQPTNDYGLRLVFRANATATQFFHVQVHADGYGLERYNAGAWVVKFTDHSGRANGDVIEVTFNGPNITVKRNGVTIITDSDATFQTNTIHGMAFYQSATGATNGSKTDDFKIESLSAGTAFNQSVGGASVTSAGVLQRSPRFGKTVGSATVTTSGTMIKQTSKRPGAATITPTQTMVRSTAKTTGQATVTPSSVLGRGIAFSKTVGGAILTPIGSVAQTIVGLAVAAGGAILQPFGSLAKRTYKGVGGTVTAVGNAAKGLFKSVGGGTVTPSGTVSSQLNPEPAPTILKTAINWVMKGLKNFFD